MDMGQKLNVVLGLTRAGRTISEAIVAGALTMAEGFALNDIVNYIEQTYRGKTITFHTITTALKNAKLPISYANLKTILDSLDGGYVDVKPFKAWLESNKEKLLKGEVPNPE